MEIEKLENAIKKYERMLEAQTKLVILTTKLLEKKGVDIIPQQAYYILYCRGDFGFDLSVNEYWEKNKKDEAFQKKVKELLAIFSKK